MIGFSVELDCFQERLSVVRVLVETGVWQALRGGRCQVLRRGEGMNQTHWLPNNDTLYTDSRV